MASITSCSLGNKQRKQYNPRDTSNNLLYHLLTFTNGGNGKDNSMSGSREKRPLRKVRPCESLHTRGELEGKEREQEVKRSPKQQKRKCLWTLRTQLLVRGRGSCWGVKSKEGRAGPVEGGWESLAEHSRVYPLGRRSHTPHYKQKEDIKKAS